MFDSFCCTSNVSKKIRKEVAAASLFYKIAEFDLRGKELWSIEKTSPTQLAVQSRLPVNEQPHDDRGDSHEGPVDTDDDPFTDKVVFLKPESNCNPDHGRYQSG